MQCFRQHGVRSQRIGDPNLQSGGLNRFVDRVQGGLVWSCHERNNDCVTRIGVLLFLGSLLHDLLEERANAVRFTPGVGEVQAWFGPVGANQVHHFGGETGFVAFGCSEGDEDQGWCSYPLVEGQRVTMPPRTPPSRGNTGGSRSELCIPSELTRVIVTIGSIGPITVDSQR